MLLAIGFLLKGFMAILHQPLSADAMEVGSTVCTLLGCAGMAAGSIFSVAAIVFWRRRAWLAVG